MSVRELNMTISSDVQKPPDLDENFNPVQPPDLDASGKPIETKSVVTPTQQTTVTPPSSGSSIFGDKVSNDSLTSLITGKPTEQPKSNLLSDIWDKISSPIPAISDFAKSVGNKLNEGAVGKSPILDTMRGFGAGALQGAANLATPLNLTTAALGGAEYGAGKAGLSSIANLASMGSKVSGIPTAIHGASDVFSPDSSLGQRAMGLGEMAGGVMPFMHTPAVNKIGDSVLSKEPIPTDLPLNEPVQSPIPRTQIPETTVKLYRYEGGKEGSDINGLNFTSSINQANYYKKPNSNLITLEVPKSFIEDYNARTDNNPSNSVFRLSQNDINDFKANNKSLIDISGNKIQNVDSDYVQGTLGGAGKGPSGLSVEDLQIDGSNKDFDVTYRSSNGNVIATARVHRNESGELRITDMASDKTKGLLQGRAIKSITDKLKEMNVTGIDGPITQDAKNLVNKINEPSAIFIKKPTPEVIKQVMTKGYVFDSIRDDGAFKMVKSDKPVDLPRINDLNSGSQTVDTLQNAPESNMGGPTSVSPNEASTNGSLPPSQGRSVVGQSEPSPKPTSNALMEAMNFPRSVMASLNFHAPLRQGLALIHKPAYWTSLSDMFKAWSSEGAYNKIQDDILSQPLFRPRTNPTTGEVLPSFAESAGLKLTDLKSLSSREEAIMNNWAEKVPGVRRSNRAYTVFLNKLRADTFTSLIGDSKVMGVDGTMNMPVARALADFVNTASGRGSLGPLEKSATALNTMLFSPRLIASRVKLLNPAYYIMADPQVRKEALKSLFAVAGVGATLGQLGKMAGGTVESNPTSSDFGKVKIGNVRLDPFGGFQQYVVAASKLISGKSTSLSGKESDLNNPRYGGQTRMDVVKNLGVSKLNPVMSFAYSLLNGSKEQTGQPMNFGTPNPFDNSIAQRFIPIVMQDTYEVAKENPSLLPITVPLNTFGMSVGVNDVGR